MIDWRKFWKGVKLDYHTRRVTWYNDRIEQYHKKRLLNLKKGWAIAKTMPQTCDVRLICPKKKCSMWEWLRFIDVDVDDFGRTNYVCDGCGERVTFKLNDAGEVTYGD